VVKESASWRRSLCRLQGQEYLLVTRKKLKVHGSERRVLKATLGGKTRL
jgi:hypothetical protein